MKSLSLASLCVVASLSAFGQNWQPGKLFLHNGDSISGEIDFEDWKVSPTFVTFRSNGQVRAYDQAELNSFFVNEKTQRYQLVRARLKYINDVPVKAGGSPIDHEDSVAVYSEVLYSNRNMALYSLQDSWEDERLFIMKDGEVRELIHFTVTIDRDGRNFNQENNSYREQLKQLLKDCDVEINSSVVYSSREIIPVLRKYSSCKGYELSVERIEKRALVSVGLHGGVGFYKGFVHLNGHKFTGAIDVQILSKRSHGNNLIWVEAGYLPALGPDKFADPFVFGLYGGRYFTSGKVQPVIFTGISSVNRVFDTGVGIAINKSLIFCGSFSFLHTLVEGDIYYSYKIKFYPRFGR